MLNINRISNRVGMPLKLKVIGYYFILSILISACGGVSGETDQESQNVYSLPMTSVSLENRQAFSDPDENWTISGDVHSDFTIESDMSLVEGTGAIVNVPTDEHQSNLLTEMEHGDIELSLEFLVPKGSNSGLYFQGRYELQILDSWRKTNPQSSDVGGIYERWDETMPEGDRGYEGKAPKVNAGLAPGLWQEFRVLFRAPRFNDAGEKTENARFEEVYLNGALIHKDVEITGPTRGAMSNDETAKGPLMIQGDHGPVAFRNIEYKLYEQTDSLELSPLTYKVYDYEGDRTPQNFDNLELLKEGTTDSFNVASISPKDEHYATHFSGELNVPVSGDYLFESDMSNGGNLYINGELILENTGEFEGVRPSKIITLEEGTHQLEVTHFQIRRGTHVALYYEGPTMEKRTLASKPPWGGREGPEPLTVDLQTDRPEIIGGFTNYNGEKRTHTLSVGFDEGIHYSYDLQSGALLKFWRDPFVDLSRMWVGRGNEQLLVPMNVAIEDLAGSPLTVSEADKDFFNRDNAVRDYNLNSDGEPIFHTGFSGITIEDYIHPEENSMGFIRSLKFSSEGEVDYASAIIAKNRSIDRLSDALFRIGGHYYIEITEDGVDDVTITEIDNSQKTLTIPVLQGTNQTEIEYLLIW